MYCGIAGNYACTPVWKLYESGLWSQMFHSPFQFFCCLFGSCTVDVRTYSFFKILWISYVFHHSFCMGENLAIAVRPYIDCTNLNWYHKCPTHWFFPFGCHLHPVHLIYGRTANLKRSVHMYCGIAGNYGCAPIQKLYESRLSSQMFHAPFQSFWL